MKRLAHDDDETWPFSRGGRYRGGHWGLLETGKPLKISVETEKKIAQKRKTAEHNDQNRKFTNLNPPTLDTTAKYSYYIWHIL